MSADAALIQSSKRASIILLVLAEIAGMSLWFASAAILPDMVRESGIDAVRQAMLSSGVQLGFVVGALAVAVSLPAGASASVPLIPHRWW